MKKIILFACALFTTLTIHAELHYTSYGDGWRIGLNENVVVDIDNDGADDFYVNQYTDELGFTPIFAKGCFSSESSLAYTVFGARELKIHQAGDILDASAPTFEFIDDGRGSAYSSSTNQFADGWVDGQDTYIGFFIFTSGRFGWMKVAVDLSTQELIIKEMAYNDESYGAIEIGYTGVPITPNLPNVNANDGKSGDYETALETSTNELTAIENLVITPNPAADQFTIILNNTSNEDLSIVISNSVGKEVFRTTNNIIPGEFTLDVSVSNWANGIYFIQFHGAKGIKTERISIAN